MSSSTKEKLLRPATSAAFSTALSILVLSKGTRSHSLFFINLIFIQQLFNKYKNKN